MKQYYKILAAAVLYLAAMSASAQYTLVMTDETRVDVASGQFSFSGDGQDGTMIVTEAGSFPLTSVARVETPAATAPVVLAYHPYYSSKLPLASQVTHINYGFAEVYVKNNVYKGFKLQGNESAFKKCVALKDENPAIKICLSFTHTVVNSDNKQDGGFSCIAASEEYRRQFAEDCLAFIEKWGIDGVDLDWEFPGISWSGAACDPKHDVENFTLLLEQLRRTLGHKYLLTFAGYCMDKKSTTGGWKFIDLKAAEPYVDFVNVMCYDFDCAPNFHNAIKSTKSYWDIERTVKAYNKAKFPMYKVVLGIPFYLRHSYSESPTTAFSNMATLGTKPNFVIDNWDDKAQVPYVTYQGNMWGSYDNPKSIALKGVYAREKGMLGLFYWCTYEDTTDHTLAKATWQAVRDNWDE